MNRHCDYSEYFDFEATALIRHKERASGFWEIELEFEEGIDRWGEDTSDGHMQFDECGCYHEKLIAKEDKMYCIKCFEEKTQLILAFGAA